MSELPLETNEHREHAEHAAHARDPFITAVSVTIAALAVVTALVGSLEITEDGGAITASSRAVLAQDRATDAWNAYQAGSLKKHLYDLAADGASVDTGRMTKYRQQSVHFASDQKLNQAEARKQEAARDQALETSERHEHRHRGLTIAATLLQIGIAVSTVAIITSRRPFWWAAIVLGVLGAAGAAGAYWL